MPLIVDLRDIVEQWGELDYYTRSFTGIQWIDNIVKKIYTARNMNQRNRVLRQATAVTTVSPWHQKTLAQYNDKTYLIYNGFDANTFYPRAVKTPTFDINFIGKYYSHYAKCPTLLFEAIQDLIREKKVKRDDLHVNFYTNAIGQQTFENLSKKYALEQIVSVHNYIPRSELINYMHYSSILLILTTSCKQNGTHGMMGTKFYEILGVEKPCLCLNSDEECLADAIEQTNAGLAATQVDEVKDFILTKYYEWLKNGYTRQAVVNKEQFTRQHEAAQFEQLFIQCIQR